MSSVPSAKCCLATKQSPAPSEMMCYRAKGKTQGERSVRLKWGSRNTDLI